MKTKYHFDTKTLRPPTRWQGQRYENTPAYIAIIARYALISLCIHMPQNTLKNVALWLLTLKKGKTHMSEELERIKKSHIIAMACLDVKEKDKETEQAIEIVEKREKALKVIKEVIPIEEEDFYYDKETDTYFFVGGKVSKNQYDLLKEVLLNE